MKKIFLTIKPLKKEIKVNDLKQYMIDGYEEIRAVKLEKEELELKLEEEKKNKYLYETSLVALEEFRKRDNENKEQINNLTIKIAQKDDEIYKVKSEINTYKINEYNFKKADEEKEKVFKKKYKEILSNAIINEKGNLSKEKIIKIISKQLKEENLNAN